MFLDQDPSSTDDCEIVQPPAECPTPPSPSSTSAVPDSSTTTVPKASPTTPVTLSPELKVDLLPIIAVSSISAVVILVLGGIIVILVCKMSSGKFVCVCACVRYRVHYRANIENIYSKVGIGDMSPIFIVKRSVVKISHAFPLLGFSITESKEGHQRKHAQSKILVL